MSSSDHPSSCFWRYLFLQHLWDAYSLRRRYPTDLHQSQEKNFLFCLPVFKFLTIKNGRFCTVSIVFVFRRTSHWVFHTPRIGTETLLGVAIRTGALIPIEGVKNTRRGGLNWVFKTKNFFPLFLSRKSFQN